jgi:hypothetical protein
VIIRLVALSIWLTGPFTFVLLVGLHLGRRPCPGIRLLDEVSEPMVIVAATVLAFAVAGLIIAISNPYGG